MHGHPGQALAAMCIQRPVQNRGRQNHEFLAAEIWPDDEAPAGIGNRRFRTPFQAQPFDEEPGSGPLKYRHAIFDGMSRHPVLTPVRWDETGAGGAVFDFEDIQDECRVAG
ncbi:hypothetical protein [Streptomyces caniferus]|uniref:hypothetical protein n=1 Tax=Streptomyces caniferus TaxID=285557 RepID=UPI0037F43352